MNKALIIAAHPDDDVLGCGGLISKYINTVAFRVIFIGEGTTCRFLDVLSSEALLEIEKRKEFAVNSLRLLGVNEYEFYNVPCGRFDQYPLIEINRIIESEINLFKPDTIFTHSDCDSNQDHIKVYQSTIIATRPGSCVERLFSYEVLSSTEWGFSKAFLPNRFISLDEINVMDKCAGLSMYTSEVKDFPFPRSKDAVITQAKYRGAQSGKLYAEAFKLIRDLSL